MENTENRIKSLIQTLNLQAHPEGGYYSEVYRSKDSLDTQSGTRSLMTSIYFLLSSGDVSRFHVIKSDELWFHHEGADLTVHTLNENGHQELKLGKESPNSKPQQLVKAGTIFGSTVNSIDSYALVSCVVAPGFDFADFKLFEANELTSQFPNCKGIISRLT